MRILQINATVNTGSTGRITEEMGQVLMANGHKSFIAYGRQGQSSKSNLIKIGNQKDIYVHGVKSLLFDRHGFGSHGATKSLIKEIEAIKPDLISLHNLHGYYLNVEVLFRYLRKKEIPVFWTLYDCWSFTGHCTYFDDIGCKKWIDECRSCPKKGRYPASYLFDASKRNFHDKRVLFNLPKTLSIIVHSNWLKDLVSQSFLKNIPLHHIPNGVNVDVFKPRENHTSSKIILGVASTWDKRKGLADFIALSKKIPKGYQIVLIGLSQKQIKSLPSIMKGLRRTENLDELVDWYNKAMVFINPTWQDNFPTTNLEALACGTPVITYNTGGSPEAIDKKTGFIVEKGDLEGLVKAIKEIDKNGKNFYSKNCRDRAVKHYKKENRYNDYINLYKEMLATGA